MNTITNLVELDERGNPANPYKFARDIQSNQNESSYDTETYVLFNKGRYFETSNFNKDLLKQMSELSGIPIAHNCMFVARWDKLEDFVITCNCFGIYVSISVDWV
jgi:hypothetical protein